MGDSGKVITGLSGGVDSSVVGTLLHKAIGDRSRCVFIDLGFLSKEEGDQVGWKQKNQHVSSGKADVP